MPVVRGRKIGGTLKDISVGVDGSVWGANEQGLVWRWLGNGWQQQQNISLKSIFCHQHRRRLGRRLQRPSPPLGRFAVAVRVVG